MNSFEIDMLCLDRAMVRGSGELLGERGSARFLYDRIGRGYHLVCQNAEDGEARLYEHEHRGYPLLVINNTELAGKAFARYGFSHLLQCYQYVYTGDVPVQDERLTVRPATLEDFQAITAVYDLLSKEDLTENIQRGNLLMGYYGSSLVGFIGEHLEGSMGMLYVFPTFRRMGFAQALENHLIARTLRSGLRPFCQVQTHNTESVALQQKLGLVRSENTMCWLIR